MKFFVYIITQCVSDEERRFALEHGERSRLCSLKLFFILDPYSNLDHKQISPVLVAFEQELSRFIKYIKKKSEPELKIKKNDEEPLARGYEYYISD